MADDKPEELLKTMEKLSRGIKDSELRSYQSCQKYFRDRVTEAERARDFSKKQQQRVSTVSLDSKLGSSRLLVDEEPLKTSGLLDDSVEEERKDKPMPKGLPLVSRKTRRCFDCNKLLTKSFRTFRNEHKVELGHSEPKVLQCQKCPPTERILMRTLFPMKFVQDGKERQLKDK